MLDKAKQAAGQLRHVFANAIRKVARFIENKPPNENDKEEKIDETRRNILKGGLLVATATPVKALTSASTLSSELASSLVKIKKINLEYLMRVVEANTMSRHGLLQILRSLKYGNGVFDELDRLLSFINSNDLSKMDSELWSNWASENVETLRESLEFIMSWQDPNFDLTKLTDPEIASVLESLDIGVSKEQLHKMAKFKTIGNLQSRLREGVYKSFNEFLKKYKENPGNEFLKKVVTEIHEHINDNWAFRRWLQDSGKQDFLSELDTVVQDIMNKEALLQKLKNGELPSGDELKHLSKSDVIKISPNAIFTASYPAAKDFVRSQIGGGAKSVTLLSPNYSVTISFPAGKYREFMQEFQKAGKESSGFVKVVIAG